VYKPRFFVQLFGKDELVSIVLELVDILLVGREKRDTGTSRAAESASAHRSGYRSIGRTLTKKNQEGNCDGCDNSLSTAESLLPPMDHRVDRQGRGVRRLSALQAADY
jgi:hypothetical protein